MPAPNACNRFAALALLCLLTGCSDTQQAPPVDAAFRAEVAAALAEIERRGLPEWATYGRSRLDIITEYVACPGYAYALEVGDGRQAVWLSPRWRGLSVGERGEILLEELWHVRTRIYTNAPEMLRLLDTYNQG